MFYQASCAFSNGCFVANSSTCKPCIVQKLHAFLPAADAAAQVFNTTLRVTTTEGQLYELGINPGSTKVKDIREAVANKMNLKYDEVNRINF